MAKEIKGFTGEYEFLSNAYPCTVEYKGLKYTNAEAAFQASRCFDENAKKKFTKLSASKAREKGRKVTSIDPAFVVYEVDIMYDVLSHKFKQNEDLKNKLLATGDAKLINESVFRDTLYGVHDGVGDNMLGNLLEELRDDLK